MIMLTREDACEDHADPEADGVSRAAPSGHGLAPRAPAFDHWALLYENEQEFLAATVPFVLEALEREGPVMVALTESRARALAGELGVAADLVRFVRMESLGANPARIIPAWRRFVESNAAAEQPIRGIGEPIWKGRGAAELEECRRHEALLNVAFEAGRAWELMCPYDTSALDEPVLAGACHTHPTLSERGRRHDSEEWPARAEPIDPFEGRLAEPDGAIFEMRFDEARLAAVRGVVAAHAARAGLSATRGADLVLAVNELAANSVCHGGGKGTLRIWQQDAALVCEVMDGGRIRDPMAGRSEPPTSQAGGRGLWIVNQVCDLVQVRSGVGTAIRLHMRLG